MERYIYLILLLAWEFLLFFFAYKKFNKVFFSPSVYTLLVFIVSTSLCLYCVDYWGVKFYSTTLITLSFGLFMTVLAELMFSTNKVSKSEYKKVVFKLPALLKIGLSLGCVLATFLYYREIQKIGLAHSMGMNEAIANVKEDWDYYESQFNPIVRQGYKLVIGVAYCFTFIFINNYNVCKQKFSDSFWYILPLFCGVIINLLSGSRGDMLRMLLLFLFTYYICKWQATGWKKQPTKQIIKIAVPAFALLLSVFFAARLFVKVDVENQKNIGGPVEYLAYYIGSPVQVFNIHAEQLELRGEKNDDATFGAFTFSGIYSLLQNVGVLGEDAVKSPKVGLGFEYLGTKSNDAGNVDTIFGPPHVDYGLAGMCMYVFIIYAIISYYFYRKILYHSLSMKFIKNFIIFSFFYYEIEMSFYSDVIYQIFGQTGLLQLVFLLILVKIIVRPKYLVKVN